MNLARATQEDSKRLQQDGVNRHGHKNHEVMADLEDARSDLGHK